MAAEPTVVKEGTTATGMSRRLDIEDREYNEAEYKDLMKLYEGTLGKISEGEIVKGRIVAIGDTEVSVDIGFKSEGVVPIAEFTNRDDLKVGDEIEVFLESVENKDGQLVLSRKRADFMRIWERVTKSFETGEVLQGRCVRRIKGGIVVDLLGDRCLPPRFANRCSSRARF
jgi:small subunit ribosomal protein S1